MLGTATLQLPPGVPSGKQAMPGLELAGAKTELAGTTSETSTLVAATSPVLVTRTSKTSVAPDATVPEASCLSITSVGPEGGLTTVSQTAPTQAVLEMVGSGSGSGSSSRTEKSTASEPPAGRAPSARLQTEPA